MKKDATLSPCEMYRYALTREWAELGDTLVIVMLNPSTADAELDDPTIRRCISFAKREGYAGIIVVNVFGYRATNPKDLLEAEDAIGGLNVEMVNGLVAGQDVLCAWGASVPAKLMDAVGAAEECIRLRAARMLCLGRTKSGAPRHPLYVKGDTPMEIYE